MAGCTAMTRKKSSVMRVTLVNSAELATINRRLWDIEDAIRAKEAARSFDADFISLARAVYHNNDERSRIKRAINGLLGSAIIEEKQYVGYRDDA